MPDRRTGKMLIDRISSRLPSVICAWRTTHPTQRFLCHFPRNRDELFAAIAGIKPESGESSLWGGQTTSALAQSLPSKGRLRRL